ncbi:hypothetical protein BH09SUM1_BH09SUM1_27780 [soil metagenome]
MATPFASDIRISSTNLAQTAGATITYKLGEAADTVTIDLLDSTDAVVGTFAGTATVGSNSVVWNGTTDNAAGSYLSLASNYKLRVTAAKNTASAWTIVRSHRSVGAYGQAADQSTLFAGRNS